MAANSAPVVVTQLKDGGSLAATISKPADIDISAGTSDWIHWGNPDAPNNFDRKAGIAPQISDFTTLANGDYFTFDASGIGSVNYSWSAGTPTISQSGTGTQAFMQGFGNGFSLTIPADTTVRTANLYLGYGFGSWKMRASLSDGSAVPWTNVFSAAALDSYEERVVTIQFQAASAGQKLLLTGEVTDSLGFGYVDLESATVSDQNGPTITSVTPATRGPGTTLSIVGSNFGGTAGTVTLNGAPLTVNSWNDGSIAATLSGGYSSGFLVVSRGLANSNPFPFTYTGPVITALIPDAGGPGTTVSIQGQNFGVTQGQVQVTFGGVQANIVGNTGNTIQAVVPPGIGFGPTSVVVQLGAQPTNALRFDVVPAPVLAAITPNSGITGETVKISGANFGLFQANSMVYFGQIAAQPVAWSESIITVPVPPHFFGGIVTAVVAGQRSNGLPFKVPLRCASDCNAQPTSISLSPQNLSVVVGDQVELGVTSNFGEGVAYPQFSLSDATLGMMSVSNGVATFTALAPGTATVTATAGSFGASTTITIYGGAELPDGTVQWHVPMPGLDGASQLPEFIPAQPAVDAQTATFVMDDSNINNVTIHALNSNGRQLWSWITGSNDDKFFFGTSLLPTPSGGVAYATDNAIASLDPNGNPLWSYPGVEVSGVPMAVGYDGTVYAVVDTNPAIASISPGFIADFPEESSPTGQYQTYLVALDGQTGQEKFKIPLPRNRSTNNAFFNGTGGDITSTSQTDQDQTPQLSGPMVLADGSVNLVVFTQTGSTTAVPNGTQSIPSCISNRTCDQPLLEYWQATTDQAQSSVRIETDLLHVNPDGSSQLYTLNQSGSSWDQIGWHFVAHACSGYTPGFCDTLINSIYYRFEALAWYAGNGPSNLVGPNGLDLQLVPNGSGGLLVSSDATDANGQDTTVWLKNVQQPGSSGDGPEFSLPIEVIHNLVIGENGTAFAAGYSTDFLSPRLLSFNLNSGAANWTYDSTFGGYNGWVDLVAAGPDGSLRATEGFYKEARVAFTLDANGVRTDDPVSGDQITFLTSAGAGSRTWLGADQTTLASMGGFENVFGMPASMQSGMSIGSPGITAFLQTVIARIFSMYPQHSPERQEGQVCPPLDGPTSKVLMTAYTSIHGFLSNSSNCPKCDSQIFKPLNMTRSDFVEYLARDPQFCDGTKSVEAGGTIGQKFKTVADFFQSERKNGAHLTAVTVLAGHDKPLWIFFDPAEIQTDPSKSDPHFYPSMFFHEGLHGYTKLGDGDPMAVHGLGLCQILGIDKISKFSNCAVETIDVTYWIEDLAFPLQ